MPTTIEYRVKCKNGEKKLVETGVSIGLEGQGTVLVLVTRDVGERKAQEYEKRERYYYACVCSHPISR